MNSKTPKPYDVLLGILTKTYLVSTTHSRAPFKTKNGKFCILETIEWDYAKIPSYEKSLLAALSESETECDAYCKRCCQDLAKNGGFSGAGVLRIDSKECKLVWSRTSVTVAEGAPPVYNDPVAMSGNWRD
jgi:hypothetical protein